MKQVNGGTSAFFGTFPQRLGAVASGDNRAMIKPGGQLPRRRASQLDDVIEHPNRMAESQRGQYCLRGHR